MLQSTEKTLFDPISESGHQEFNNQLINEFRAHGQIKIVSKKLDVKRQIVYIIISLYNHFVMFRKAKEGDVFIVFTNLSLYFISFLFNKKGVKFIVHNNLDFAITGNSLHRVFYKRIAKKFELIYLERRIEEVARSTFKHKKSIYYPHPILSIRPQAVKSQVFVSGRNLTLSGFKKIIEMEKDSEVIIYCNKYFEEFDDSESIRTGYIQDFDDVLAVSKRIYLPGNYKYRVSGILYKVLNNTHTEIFINDERLIMELKERFKEGITKNVKFLNL